MTATVLGLDDKVSKSGDTMTGNLTVPSLTVTGQLNANSDFETGLAPWTLGVGTSFTQSSTYAYTGTYSARLVPDGVSSLAYFQSELIPCAASSSFTVQSWALCPTGYAPGGGNGYSVSVNWYDTTTAYLSTSYMHISLTAGVWTPYAATYTSPANAAYLSIDPNLGGTPPATAIVYVDQVKVAQASSQNLASVIAQQLQVPAAGAAGKVLTADAFGNATWQTGGGIGATGWINVLAAPYSAYGDGVHDDTAAINAALAAANTAGGGTVYLPWTSGGYLISAELDRPPMVTLVGDTRVSLGEAPATVPAVSRIIASASWAPGSATGMVRIRSMTAGGWSTQNFWGGMRSLMLDCSLNTSANLNCLYYVGPVFDDHLEDVMLYKAGHNGVLAASQAESGFTQTFPWHARWRRVTAYDCVNRGFDLTNFTDGSYDDCMAFGNGSHGWVLTNVPNGSLRGCRAEWNSGSGFDMTGAGTGISLVGCSTDQNTQRGIFISSVTDATAGAISISGGKFHCDGHDGTSAGIEIASTTVPVAITGVVVEADSYSGTTYPTAGLSVTGSSYITVGASTIGGHTAGVKNGGTNTVLLLNGVIETVGALGSTAVSPTEIYAVKTSNQTTTSNTTLANDTALFTPTLPPTSTWEVTGLIAYDDSTTGDFKIAWTTPSGSTFVWNGAGAGTGASTSPINLGGAIASASSTGAYGGIGAGTEVPVLIQGILTVTTAGVLQLQWAQNTTDTATLTVRAGSYLRLKRIA